MPAFNHVVTMTVVWLVVEVVGLTSYTGVIASAATTESARFLLMKYFVFGSKGLLWM
jgi:putative flippase GtrA